MVHTWNARFSLDNSVFQAELFVIKIAVLWADSFDNKSFLISSDSLTGWMVLQNAHTLDFVNSDILSLIYKYTKTFHFKWIK